MILVDTGYLVALVDGRDQLHHGALAWDAVLIAPLLVSHYVLLESINYFSKPPTREKVHHMLDFMQSHTGYLILPASDELFDSGLTLHRQMQDQSWSLTDCICFQIMRERGINRAPAYDHHFEQAGFEALLRRDP